MLVANKAKVAKTRLETLICIPLDWNLKVKSSVTTSGRATPHKRTSDIQTEGPLRQDDSLQLISAVTNLQKNSSFLWIIGIVSP